MNPHSDARLPDLLWIEVQRLKRKIQELQSRDESTRWNTKFEELVKKVQALRTTTENHETYINTWKNAGFTTQELEQQLDSFNRNASIQTLIDEVSSKNVAIGVGFTELTFKDDELERMSALCTPGFPKNNLSCGLLQVSGILNSIGQYEYDYSSKRIHMVITEDGTGKGQVKVMIPAISVTFTFDLDNHIVVWDDQKVEVRRKSILLKYIRTGDVISVYASNLEINLKTQQLNETYVKKQELSVMSFLALVQDLPRNMTNIMTIIPDWNGDNPITLELYLRKNTINELYDVFSIYVNESSRQGPLSLASSYAQSAIASLSSTNQILASTILKQEASYESETGVQDILITSSGIDQQVFKTNEDFPSTSAYTTSFQTERTFFRNLALVPDNVTGMIGRVNFSVDIPNRITIGDENKRMIHFTSMNQSVSSGVNYQMVRKGEGFRTSVKAQIDWMPDTNIPINLDNMETGIWIGKDTQNLRPVKLNIDTQATISKTTSSGTVQTMIDFNEMGCTYDLTDKIMIWGKKIQADFSGIFRIRVDASTLLDVGGAEDLTLAISYKLDGTDKRENVTCVRKYVNAGGTKQKLVYEGTFGKAKKSGLYVLGHVSSITNTGMNRGWITGYGEAQIKQGIFIGESMLYEKRSMDSSILLGKNAAKPPERVVFGIDGNNVIKGTYYIAPILNTARYKIDKYNGMILGIDIFSYFGSEEKVLLFHKTNDADISIASLDQGFGIRLPQLIGVKSGRIETATIDGHFPQTVIPKVLNIGSINVNGTVLDNTVAWLAIEPMRLTITSITSNKVQELALPNGLYSNIELNEDTIKLIENVEMLKRYSKTLQGLLDNVELRVSHIEQVVDNIIDVVSSINDRLDNFIEQATQPHKPSPWGIAGSIMGFLSTSVGMFFPLVGTAIGVAGQIVEGIGSLTEGDVATGTMEMITGGLAAGLGAYKFGKRMKVKLGAVKVINDGPRPMLGNNKVGMKIKNRLITNGETEPPPSYAEATMGRNVRRKRPQLDFAVQTTTVEKVQDNSKVKYRLHSSTTQPYQSHNHEEWESIGGSGAIKHAMLDYKVTDDCNINGVVLSRKIDGQPRLLLNKNGVVEITPLTDSLMRKALGNQWKDGALNDVIIRRYESLAYTSTSRTNYPMDEDIVRMLAMTGSSTNITESHALRSSSLLAYNDKLGSNWMHQLGPRSIPIQIAEQSFNDSIYTLNTIFIEKHKDSQDSRGYMDDVANTLLNVNIKAMLTDTVE